MTPRLKEIYSKEIQPALKDSLGLKNIYMAPRIEKIVLNMGLGIDGADAKILKAAEDDMGRVQHGSRSQHHPAGHHSRATC